MTLDSMTADKDVNDTWTWTARVGEQITHYLIRESRTEAHTSACEGDPRDSLRVADAWRNSGWEYDQTSRGCVHEGERDPI